MSESIERLAYWTSLIRQIKSEGLEPDSLIDTTTIHQRHTYVTIDNELSRLERTVGMVLKDDETTVMLDREDTLKVVQRLSAMTNRLREVLEPDDMDASVDPEPPVFTEDQKQTWETPNEYATVAYNWGWVLLSRWSAADNPTSIDLTHALRDNDGKVTSTIVTTWNRGRMIHAQREFTDLGEKMSISRAGHPEGYLEEQVYLWLSTNSNARPTPPKTSTTIVTGSLADATNLEAVVAYARGFGWQGEGEPYFTDIPHRRWMEESRGTNLTKEINNGLVTLTIGALHNTHTDGWRYGPAKLLWEPLSMYQTDKAHADTIPMPWYSHELATYVSTLEKWITPTYWSI